MSKQSKTLARTPAQAQDRLKRALLEGRYQTALDLAKQLYKANPSAEHREILLDAALSRADQTARQGNRGGAVELVRAYLPLVQDDPPRLAKCVTLLSAWGEVGLVLSLRQNAPVATTCDAVIADSLLAHPQRREQAPAAWQADCAHIEQAFREAVEGHDQKARETLQRIGLQSPYLEWRVFLRGLIAYYNGQDDRARENWARLDSARLPARLAAPLRSTIDPDFKAALPDQARAAVAAAAAGLTLDAMEGQLQRIAKGLNSERPNYLDVLRVSAGLLPELRKASPGLAERLQNCVYWRMAKDCIPDDVLAYQRLLGAPADDPGLDRLKALGAESVGATDVAHGYWRQYADTLAGPLPGWSPDQAARARSLVYLRMARNAAALPAMLRVTPDAVDCLRQAVKLAPDLDEAHEELHCQLRREKKTAQAEAAVREHLRIQPRNVAALRGLGELCEERNDLPAALEAYTRALALNPLDPQLRAAARQVRWRHAAALSGCGDVAAARPLFEAALADPDRPRTGFIQAIWALAEFKAGSAERGESLLALARAEAPQPIALAWLLVVESKRLKLKKPPQAEFTRQWNDLLAQPATPRAAIDLIVYSETYSSRATFRGLATWEKAVQKYAASVPVSAYGDEELREYCRYLERRNLDRELSALLASARRRFPQQAYYPYLEAQRLLRARNLSPFAFLSSLREAQEKALNTKDDWVLGAIRELIAGLANDPRMLQLARELTPGFASGFDVDDEEDDW